MRMSELSKLSTLCKCSISIEINNHRNTYENIEGYLLDRSEYDAINDFLEEEGIDKEVYNKIIELDNLVRIDAYNENAVGFFTVYHYDVDLAIHEMISIIESE